MTVFLCHVPTTQLRERMFYLCLERWSEEKCKLHKIFCHGNRDAFQKDRRLIAESFGEDIYILADDDCFVPRLNVNEIQAVMDSHPEFSILSLMPTNCNITPWGDGYMDDEVMEHVSVGGVRFCRKGLPFPPLDGPGYDMAQCEAIRKSGKKVGYLRNHPMIHLGEGFSTVW